MAPDECQTTKKVDVAAMDKGTPVPEVTETEVDHVARVLRATLMIFAQGMAGAPSTWARNAVGVHLDEARRRLASYERLAASLRPTEAPELRPNVVQMQEARPTAKERWRARMEKQARDRN
jgi:hypothetical protein